MDTEHPPEGDVYSGLRPSAEVDRLCARIAATAEGVFDLRQRPRPPALRRRLVDGVGFGSAPATRLGFVLLVADELVDNAYRHTGAPLSLRYTRHRAGLLLEVTDGEPRNAHTLTAIRGGAHSRGTGLAVVANLVLAWGVDRDVTEKTVWALLPDRA
ncbi:ATP-binding protein [Amycolatopsis sp. cmx-4-83]|uniref:ATP-binding protein n=1 Tax=Amycolatopsis sp. cmx-4-83 TaxID=2790940 RepID=UPI0039792E12